MRYGSYLLLCSILTTVSCSSQQSAEKPANSTTDIKSKLQCDPDNGGIELPAEFCALVVADDIGRARHLFITDEGIIYVALRKTDGAAGGIVVLRDTDGDGRADSKQQFGEHYGTGIEVRDSYLYFGTNESILRYRLTENQPVPSGTPEILIHGLPEQRTHAAKPFTFDDRDNLFVTIGGPSNSCQIAARTKGSPGINPCPQRERQASIWRFDSRRIEQTQDADGFRFASGIRHAVAIAFNPRSKQIFVVQHGRDQLDTLWPDYFDAEDNAEIPAEEFLVLYEGADFMWPYCYYDPIQGKKLLSPEYGGDGIKVGDCDKAPAPLVAFPGHWAPNDLLFYQGTMFPKRFQGGAFIAFHGSWNRAPLPQRGYNVVFVPMMNEEVTGPWEVFVDGFAGRELLESPRDAAFRPTGLAEGPDGSLYVSDSVRGRIWRIIVPQD